MGKDICFLAPHCCIRVHKQAIALRKLGYDIHLITNNRNTGTGLFKSVSYYDSPSQLESSLRFVSTVTKLIHVHNEPNWPASFARDILNDSLIVLDMHDSNYWRTDIEEVEGLIKESVSWYEEDVAVACSDGFIVPSEACREELSERTDKPVVFVPSVTPKAHMTQGFAMFSGGLVSQGGHSTPNTPGSKWRDYTELYKYMRGKKQVYAYSPSFTLEPPNDVDLHYQKLGIKRGRFAYKDLLEIIGRHTWNLVGNWHTEKPAKVWDYALPNKFFDAMAALTPSVIIGASEPARIAEEYGLGIAVDHPQELLDRWDEHIECRINLRKHRMQFIMEKWISNLTDLYSNISGGEY